MIEGCSPECLGRLLEGVGNGVRRWMVASSPQVTAADDKTRRTDCPIHFLHFYGAFRPFFQGETCHIYLVCGHLRCMLRGLAPTPRADGANTESWRDRKLPNNQCVPHYISFTPSASPTEQILDAEGKRWLRRGAGMKKAGRLKRPAQLSITCLARYAVPNQPQP